MNEEELKKLLYKIYLKSPANLFCEFMNECENVYNKPITNFYDLTHNNNKKIKGDIFEIFCVLYLKFIKNYSNVWLLSETPNDILEMLSLKKKDMGIDIIVENNGHFFAVQCKYKNTKSTSKTLSWKNLSTFYALSSKTGPWEKNIVMTTCKNINYQGISTERDISYCFGTFNNIKKDDWLLMCKVTKGYVLGTSNEESTDCNYINRSKTNEIDFNTITDIDSLSEKDRIRYLRLIKFTK
jgi:hypothetical protein